MITANNLNGHVLVQEILSTPFDPETLDLAALKLRQFHAITPDKDYPYEGYAYSNGLYGFAWTTYAKMPVISQRVLVAVTVAPGLMKVRNLELNLPDGNHKRNVINAAPIKRTLHEADLIQSDVLPRLVLAKSLLDLDGIFYEKYGIEVLPYEVKTAIAARLERETSA